MPLLKRKPFTPEQPPADLKADEEVFVCQHTNEIFRNYESFFKRTILCNSLVWSCKFTGKSGLTYSEALQSENELEKQGRTLPESIQRAALTVVHHIQRGRLANLCDEVYNYIKDRYQEGEEVDVLCSGKKRQGIIVDVIPPEDLPNLASPTHPPKGRKLSSSKSSGESSLPTPKKATDNNKTPSKSPTQSDSKAKTPTSRKSSISETKEGLTPSDSHRPSTSGESQTTAKPRKHSTARDGSPGSSKSQNGGDVISSPKALKQSTLDHSPTFDGKKKIVEDKPVFFSEQEVLYSPKDKPNNVPDVVVIKDDSNSQDEGCQTVKSPKNKTKCLWPLAQRYKYEVELHPEKGVKKSKDKPETVIVSAYQVSRIKGAFSREKLKVFLRISCVRSTPQSDDGFYVVKREFCEKFDLGEPVSVLRSPTTKQKKEKSKKRRSSQGAAEEGSNKKKKRKLTGDDTSAEKRKKKKQEKDREAKLKKMTPAERQKFLEQEKEKRKRILEEEKEKRKVEKEREKNELKAKREEERVKKKVERDKERERLKEQKRLEALELREWSKPREDLLLDDLKELPNPVPLSIKIPQDMFGDVVMVLEFLNIFGSVFDMRDEFPSGLSFALLEEALTEHDAEGVYYDLMQFLLGAILRTHLEEEEDEGLDRMHVTNPDKMELEEEDAGSTATVSAAASIAAAWPLLYQGKALHELIMDPFTCSELLRLHLLSSGARIGCRDASYRWQRRGGFTYSDDAVVEFRHREPNILKALLTSSVYDLGARDKLKILVALCMQMMTYATARDHMEDGFEKSRKARREWQEDQWADVRREKEEAAARYRRKQEERQRQKEDMERKKKEKEEAGTSSKPESQASSQPSKEEDKKNNGDNKSDEKSNTRRSKGKTKDEGRAPENNGEQTQKSSEASKEEELARTKEEEEELARQRKEDRRRKDTEFILELSKATAMSGLQALGRDRMFRRYWNFRSLRGVFVEDDDPEMAAFLEESDDDEESEDEDTEGAQAVEGEGVKTEGQTSNNSGLQLNGDKKGEVSLVLNGEAAQASGSGTKSESQEGATRSAEKKKEDCVAKELRAIYGNRQLVKWSLFTSTEQLDSLLDSLNQRGVRERVLRENIQQDYQNLVKAIGKCPFIEGNRIQKRETKPKGRRGGRQPQQGVDKSRYKAMEEFIEANLRDQVLDLEDRVWQGGLGGLKVDDRAAWRKTVENGIYDHLLQKASDPGDENGKDGDGGLVNGDTGTGEPASESTSEQRAHSSKQDTPNQPVANGDVESMDVQESNEVCEELERLVENPKELQLSSVPATLCPMKSEASTPVTGSRSGTPTLSLTTPLKSVNPAIKELALALLKVEQGVERKYLNPPLGEDEETKKQKQREAAAQALKEFNEMMERAEEGKKKSRKERKEGTGSQADEPENKTENGEQKDDDGSSSSSEEPAKAKTCLERWEESLMACSNLSQVFVHLNTLDQSIAWSKSVLNARCRLCRRKGDAEHMLLCDACDRGHHMYCLKPPIRQIPEGNWFCADCRPKEPRRSTRRRKPVISDDEDEEADEAGKNSGDEEESEYQCDDGSEEGEGSEEEEESDGASSEHGDACALCWEAGELLCCDTCPLAYHLSCAYPPLRRVPRGNWACQVCTGADEDRARKDRVKKATIEAAQKSLRKSAKAATRSASRSTSRQTAKDSRPSRKRRVSLSPSPPLRARRGQRRSSADSGTKSKRRRVRVESGR